MIGYLFAAIPAAAFLWCAVAVFRDGDPPIPDPDDDDRDAVQETRDDTLRDPDDEPDFGYYDDDQEAP